MSLTEFYMQKEAMRAIPKATLMVGVPVTGISAIKGIIRPKPGETKAESAQRNALLSALTIGTVGIFTHLGKKKLGKGLERAGRALGNL